MAAPSDDKSLALYCDFENVALGVRDAKYKKFDIHLILERLLVKGSIVVKKAYCDWDRYKNFKGAMHEAAFELIEIPHVRMSGKNSADIRMVVDALDLCYTKAHVDTFVIISGDSDFSPLVSKLRENAKTVIGIGVKNSTSDLLIASCDEFIYYDDLVRETERKAPSKKRASKKRASRAKSASAVDETAGEPVEGTSDDGSVDVDKGGNGDKGEDSRAAGDLEDGKAAASPGRRSRGGRRSAAGKSRSASSGTAVDIAQENTDIEASPAPADGMAIDEASDGDSVLDDVDEATAEERAQEGLDVLLETALALSTERGGADKLWGSMVKQTLKRRRPGFNESYYGFESFGKMLEEAASRGHLSLEHDDRSGGYIITRISS